MIVFLVISHRLLAITAEFNQRRTENSGITVSQDRPYWAVQPLYQIPSVISF